MVNELAQYCGAIGFGVVLLLVVLASFGHVELPELYIRTIIWASAALLVGDDVRESAVAGATTLGSKHRTTDKKRDDENE